MFFFTVFRFSKVFEPGQRVPTTIRQSGANSFTGEMVLGFLAVFQWEISRSKQRNFHEIPVKHGGLANHVTDFWRFEQYG